MRILIAGILLAVSACAVGQSYTPLQPWHNGVWSDPWHVGEGMVPTVTTIEDEPFVFLTVYLLHAGETRWFAAQGFTGEQWIDGSDGLPAACTAPCYELILYQRDAVNTEPVSVGSLWLQPSGSFLDWTILVNDPVGPILRQGTLHRLLQGAPGQPLGICNPIGGFSPPRPLAGIYCHD